MRSNQRQLDMKPRRSILMALMALGLIAALNPAPRAGATMYQCTDVSGALVYSDTMAQLRNCRALSMGAAAGVPTASSPAVPAPAIPGPNPDYGRPPEPPQDMIAVPVPADGGVPSPEQPTAQAEHPSPNPQPCFSSLNPFNPFAARPCRPAEEQLGQPAAAPPAAVIHPPGTE